MENILKQQVLDLKADRLSTHHMASNQLRLWFATLAYLLVERLRSLGLQGTDLAQATVGTKKAVTAKVTKPEIAPAHPGGRRPQRPAYIDFGQRMRVRTKAAAATSAASQTANHTQ